MAENTVDSNEVAVDLCALCGAFLNRDQGIVCIVFAVNDAGKRVTVDILICSQHGHISWTASPHKRGMQ